MCFIHNDTIQNITDPPRPHVSTQTRWSWWAHLSQPRCSTVQRVICLSLLISIEISQRIPDWEQVELNVCGYLFTRHKCIMRCVKGNVHSQNHVAVWRGQWLLFQPENLTVQHAWTASISTTMCGLLTVASGEGIKLLSVPHINLPPTIAPIEPGSLGEPHLYSLHISNPQPQPSPLETLFHYIYYAFSIRELLNVQCAMCVGVGKLRCFLLCIHGCDKPVLKRVFKEDVKRCNASGVQC